MGCKIESVIERLPRFIQRCRELGLPDPDGRPLYQYRLSTASFDKLKYELTAARSKINGGLYSEADFFVLWAAEWFRRCYRGGGRKWQLLAAELNFSLSKEEWRKLTDRGFKLWQLHSSTHNGTNYRLLNLARQGGFPVAAIEAESWASRYLEKIVAPLLASSELSFAAALELATESKHSVPETWQHDEFFILSADLALAIVFLRKEAEQGAAAEGVTPSYWLEINRPNWRASLPIVIDSEHSNKLLDNLMAAKPLKSTNGSIRAVRLMRKDGMCWQARLHLHLSGTLTHREANVLSGEYGRLRAFSAGKLAQYINGELALLESDSKDKKVWAARPLQRGALEFPIPFDVAAELELRAEDKTISRVLVPDGNAVTSHLNIFAAADDNKDALNPETIVLIGTSSGKYRADPLFIQVPEDWKLEASNGESCEFLGQGQPGHHLWRVHQGTIVRTSENELYRVLAGQEANARDQILVSGQSISCLIPSTNTQLFVGSPRVTLKERQKDRIPTSGELWQWLPTSRKWQPIKLPFMPGLYDVAWKDCHTGHIRDRCKIAVLPEDFKLQRRIISGTSEINISGWTGLSLDGYGKQIQEGRWQLLTAANERYIPCQLSWGNENKLTALLAPARPASFAYWDGQNLLPRRSFVLTDSQKLVAYADGPCTLRAQLRDGNRRIVHGAEMQWRFDSELPISTIHDDLASLLLHSGDIDAQVEMHFNETQERCWYAKQFDIELLKTADGLLPSHALHVPKVCVAGRSMANPLTEVEFCEYSSQDYNNQCSIQLPLLDGDWLIYLRTSERVISRPKLCHGLFRAETSSNPLGRIMAISDQQERKEAIGNLFIQAEAHTSEAYKIIRTIIGMVVNLRGLPYSTFDLLTGLAEHPKVAARLLLFASEDERPWVSKLTDGLPFCWFLISKDDWRDADEALYRRMLTMMEGIPDAERLVGEEIIGKYRSLITTEPALSALLSSHVHVPELLESAQIFMNRSADDSIAITFRNSFRPQLNHDLPIWSFDESFHAILDVPCAAALAALGKFSPNAEQICRIKATARNHPHYFEAAFIAYYKEKHNVYS